MDIVNICDVLHFYVMYDKISGVGAMLLSRSSRKLSRDLVSLQGESSFDYNKNDYSIDNLCDISVHRRENQYLCTGKIL